MTAAECSTISVADDDPFIIDLIGRTLMAAGHHVCVVNSGENANEHAAVHNIDLSVLDYQMRIPGISGLDAGRAKYQLTGKRFIMPIKSDEALVERAAVDGAFGFLTKPLSLAQVSNQVTIPLERISEYERLTTTLQEKTSSFDATILNSVSSARSVNTAVGILMEHVHITRAEVSQRLLIIARHHGCRLDDISEEAISDCERRCVQYKEKKG